ncbi:histidine phosphatase family protein [Rhizobium leguminosarum bv. viciae]|nr:histidine phosphatase family protein [Rhizobium leguminosarum bv. viciae]TCB24630.1 histidine phosphatase family protein [Rhizobium leguminosarum bv. viciae]
MDIAGFGFACGRTTRHSQSTDYWVGRVGSLRKFVLIRHAAPEIRPELSSRHWGLSEEGKLAASALGLRLMRFGLGELVASPEPKALSTANTIGGHLGLPVRVDDRLREHSRSTVGFLSKSNFENGICQIFSHPGEIVFGDESADMVFSRIAGAVADAEESNQGSVGFVTHGTAMTIYLSRVTGTDPMEFWRSLAMPLAVVLQDRSIVETIK